MNDEKQPVDSKGTTQDEAGKLLENLCQEGFSGDAGELALALGRDKSEIEEMLSADKTIDDDLAMKIRGVAREREIEIE